MGYPTRDLALAALGVDPNRGDGDAVITRTIGGADPQKIRFAADFYALRFDIFGVGVIRHLSGTQNCRIAAFTLKTSGRRYTLSRDLRVAGRRFERAGR